MRRSRLIAATLCACGKSSLSSTTGKRAVRYCNSTTTAATNTASLLGRAISRSLQPYSRVGNCGAGFTSDARGEEDIPDAVKDEVQAIQQSIERISKKIGLSRYVYTCQPCIWSSPEPCLTSYSYLGDSSTSFSPLTPSFPTFHRIEKRLSELKVLLDDKELWSKPERAAEMNKEASQLSQQADVALSLTSKVKEWLEMYKLARSEGESSIEEESVQNIRDLVDKAKDAYFDLLFASKADQGGCYLEVQAGAGGTESCDWADMLVRMYERWSTDQGFQVMERPFSVYKISSYSFYSSHIFFVITDLQYLLYSIK